MKTFPWYLPRARLRAGFSCGQVDGKGPAEHVGGDIWKCREVCWTGLAQVFGGVAECLEETLLGTREEG